MNRYFLAFIVIFFLIAIAIGLQAIREDIQLKSRAIDTCPEVTLPENVQCPEGTSMTFHEDENGCIEFICQ